MLHCANKLTSTIKTVIKIEKGYPSNSLASWIEFAYSHFMMVEKRGQLENLEPHFQHSDSKEVDHGAIYELEILELLEYMEIYSFKVAIAL